MTQPSDSDIIRDREALFEFFAGRGGKRPSAYAQFGYMTDSNFADFKQASDRNGAAMVPSTVYQVNAGNMVMVTARGSGVRR